MEFREYMQAQIEEMEKYKWVESEKNGRDLGDEARLDWINKYADDFRKTHECHL